MGKVYTNLMCPSGLDHHLESCVMPVTLHDSIVCHRVLAASLHGHASAACAVPSYRRLHGRARRRRAGDDGFIDSLHLARLDLGDKAGVRVKRSCDEHEPGSVLVQSMNEAGTRDRPQPRIICEQTIEECSVAIARTGVDHEPGGFVERQQIRIVVEDGKRSRLRGRPIITLDRAEDTDPLSARDPILDPYCCTVEGCGTGADPFLDSCPGVLWKDLRERLVGSRPGQGAGYDPIESGVLRHRLAHKAASRGFRIPGCSGVRRSAETWPHAAIVTRCYHLTGNRARYPANLRL